MSDDFNIKVSREEFQDLREEVTEMRTAFIGINGQGGFRGDFAELKSDVKELSKSVNNIVSSLNAFKDDQLNNHKLFATKAEVMDSEHMVLTKLNEFDRKRDDARASDRKEAEEKKRLDKIEAYEKDDFTLKKRDITIAKIALIVSAIGLAGSGILKLIELLS
jgi:hypothetical protein